MKFNYIINERKQIPVNLLLTRSMLLCRKTGHEFSFLLSLTYREHTPPAENSESD